jgi:hypothetical protein
VEPKKDQESLLAEREKTRKRGDQESLEPKEKRPVECGSGREKTRGVWNRKRDDMRSVELKERVFFVKNNQNQVWEGDLGGG